MTHSTQTKALYEQDLQRWFKDTIAELKARKLDELDVVFCLIDT